MRRYITLYWLKHQSCNAINENARSSTILYEQQGGKAKWQTLIHNGVAFPPDYVPHSIPLIYNGIEIKLDPQTEEYVTLYTKYLDTEYYKQKAFNVNFWKDFKKYAQKYGIESLDKCDFSLIRNYLLKIKEEKKNMSPEEKKILKEQKDMEDKKYNIAIVDGKPQPVGNFRMEPPSIFIGRGDHPLIGSVKKRIYPEDVILNMSSGALVPETLPNHKWGKIKHDKTVEWIASWKDTITGKYKYVWLASHSDIKGKNDMMKFDLAKKLKKKIKNIRSANEENMKSSDPVLKQIATAMFFIDKLALRVGGEKDVNECDTVGVTSLRCEHIKLLENNKIKLDFLGKDSVRYVNTIIVSDQIYNNIAEFTNNKSKNDQLFEKISSNDINKYLQSFMKNLTAKVFRTYNASYLFEHELNKLSKKYPSDEERIKQGLPPDKDPVTTTKILLDGLNTANAKVALLCNHQRQVSASFDDQVSKLKSRIDELQSKLRKTTNSDKIQKIKKNIKLLKIKKSLKIETKNISLGTSKINYIDPRITIKFIRRHNIPIEKIFTKKLIEKFNWAIQSVEDSKEIPEITDKKVSEIIKTTNVINDTNVIDNNKINDTELT